MMEKDKQKRRREWEIEQILNKKHEEKKLWMIRKYEKERFQKLEYDRKESVRRNENLEEQRSIR